MRAVIICLAGVFAAMPAYAGSLLPQETASKQQNGVNDLQLPTFADGSQAEALTFNTSGQPGSAQMFDLGGKTGTPVGGDLFQGLENSLGGVSTSSTETEIKPAQ